jgi:alpha-tubulin suppressor-like RCC1 family protein
MGLNDLGQLGSSALLNQTTPIQIATGVSKCVAGYRFSLIIKTDGTLWGMGDNGDGAWGGAILTTYSTLQRIKI